MAISIATSGDDILTGSKGADTIDGGAGADIINSGAGDDVIDGGAGDDKLNAYRSADVYVLPTKTENFGITIAEALAAGTPVIVTTK